MNWIKWIKIIVIAYFILGIALYFLQEQFLFHPEKLSKNYVRNYNMPFEEINIYSGKNDTINLVKFFPKDSITKGVVLYFHGNKQNLDRYAKFASNFTNNGYEVWMEDYPSFGKSTGSRKEDDLYLQAMSIYKMANSKFNGDSIILYGKSLGTGIASYVASKTNSKKLILETPYFSIPNLFSCYAPIYPTSIMSTYKVPTYQYLQQVKYPITIFHGTNDWVIPYRCASKLKKVLKATDEFITIENGTHHNLAEYDSYNKKLDSLLNF